MHKLVLFLFLIIGQESNATLVDDRPDDIIDIRKYIPDVKLDLRYFSKRNFLGEEVRGYLSETCLLQDHVAQSLKKVQEDLLSKNLELIIFDCFRPQVAVNHFVSWANELNDTKMKEYFYPELNKDQLFQLGYIARQSGHSKAHTVDIGMIKKGASIDRIKNLHLHDCRMPLTEEEINVGMIEMGTQFDCFDSLSHTNNIALPNKIQKNRQLLVDSMERQGFKNYSKEWWHFSHTINNYPTTFHEFFVE